METLRRAELGINLIAGATGTEHLSGLGVARVRIAGLDHKAVDHTMEQHAVIETFRSEFQEIVAVAGSVVIKTDGDITGSGLDHHFRILGLIVGHCLVRVWGLAIGMSTGQNSTTGGQHSEETRKKFHQRLFLG